MSTTFFKNFFEMLLFLTLCISNNYITKNILTMQPLILIFLLYFFFYLFKPIRGYTKRIRIFLCLIKDVLLTIKKVKKLIKLADGNMICEDHAKLTPWQREELIEKDANQVNEYIDKMTNTHLAAYGLENTEASYKPLLHRAAQSDLMENTSPEDTLKLQNWILIKQNAEIINLLKELNTRN